MLVKLSVTIPGQNCLFLPGEAQEKGVIFCLSARTILRLQVETVLSNSGVDPLTMPLAFVHLFV